MEYYTAVRIQALKLHAATWHIKQINGDKKPGFLKAYTK